MQEDPKWPGYFPDGCPSESARPPQCTVYRFIKQNAPTPTDFVPHKIIYPRSIWGSNECQACGLSVYSTLEGAQKAFEALPATKRFVAVARGCITPESGKILETPTRGNSSHITWWVYEGVDPCAMFNIA